MMRNISWPGKTIVKIINIVPRWVGFPKRQEYNVLQLGKKSEMFGANRVRLSVQGGVDVPC